MEVDLPVGLGVGGERQVLAGLLAGDARLEPLLVDLAGEALQLVLGLRERAADVGRHEAGGTLAVVRGLAPPLVVAGRLHRVDGERVAGGVFVDACGAVPDPLPPAVHRHADHELDLRHLEWRGVGVPKEVADQLPVVAHLPGAFAVAHPSGLHHRPVVAHHVDQGHEAIVKDGKLFPAESFNGRGASGGGRGTSGGGRCVGSVHGRRSCGAGESHRMRQHAGPVNRLPAIPAVNPSREVPGAGPRASGHRPIGGFGRSASSEPRAW